MKILGIGVDIIENSRISNSLKNNLFIKRIFSNSEIVSAKKIKDKKNYYAKRFAAKEAFVKAIGTGFRNNLNFKDIIDPRVLNVYPKYDLRTPSSITTSAAFIFGKIGLLSIDIVSRDYSKVKLKPNYEFLSLNKEIASKLTNTQDIRLGTEFRINKLSLRGGFTKVGSPYSVSKMMKDFNSYSFGMGFDFGETLVNFSYKTLSSETNKQLFDSGLTDSAKLNTKQSISSLSIIFKF